MQEATIVGMILMQETTNVVANVEDCPVTKSIVLNLNMHM